MSNEKALADSVKITSTTEIGDSNLRWNIKWAIIMIQGCKIK
jgi:hypothetical protein